MGSGTPQVESCAVEKDSLTHWKQLSSAHDWWKNYCVEATKCCLCCQQHPWNHSIWVWFFDGVGMLFCMIASWIWPLFKAILMGQDITLTTMLWSWDQCLWLTMLNPIERVQSWISYSEMQSLSFLGWHEALTSIHQGCNFSGIYWKSCIFVGRKTFPDFLFFSSASYQHHSGTTANPTFRWTWSHDFLPEISLFFCVPSSTVSQRELV